MPDAQIHPLGTEDTPAGYTIPKTAELLLKMGFAKFDGTNAAGPYKPCIRVISDAGTVSGEAATDEEIAAGESADVTWFPHLAAAAASTSATGQGILSAEQAQGTTQTFAAGTTSAITWDSIVTDSSGTYDVGAGHGSTFKILKSGVYLVAFQILPDPSWPTVAQGPVVFRPDVPVDIFPYSRINAYTPGSTDIGGFAGVVSTYGIIPATVSIQIGNESTAAVASVGAHELSNGTILTVARLGDEVSLP